MKKYIACLIVLIALSCSKNEQDINLEGEEILQKSILNHDPNNNWDQIELAIHIQEPRIGNPSRYSILRLSNIDNSFELIRNRDSHLSKHVIDKNEVSKVYLDGSAEIESELVEKYRLNPERNKGYRDFYRMMYGLPMSLNGKSISKYGGVEIDSYNGYECYKIPVELKEAMFSKNWIVYIAKSNCEFKGMEIVHPDDASKGERLYFENSISIDGVHIPRIRHWHEFSNNEYSGSDVIVKTL